jgi:hypothetical protein
MQRYANDRTMDRKAKLGKILTYGGLGVVIVIFVLSFQEVMLSNTFLIVTLIAMLISQYGILLSNRWGKHPRIDEVLDQALKGLDSNYSLFHYELGANHALIAPSGLFALVPVMADGEITFDGEKWWRTRIRRGKEKKRPLKNLSSDAATEVRAFNKALKKRLNDQELPEVKPILVFLHPDATVKAENAPIPAVYFKKLKGTIRKLDKGQTLEQEQVSELAEALGF